MVYYPQGLVKCNVKHKMGNKMKRDNTYARPSTLNNVVTQEWTNYPRNYLEFRKEGKCVHPCQKPIPLLEYLIKTYTKEGDMVLDNWEHRCGVRKHRKVFYRNGERRKVF